MTPSSPFRVAVVEDDPKYRESLAVLLKHSRSFEHAASFGNARAMLKELGDANTSPAWDLVLMDLELPEMNGIEATGRVKQVDPELPVVVLTSFEEPATILQAICAGARGYLVKRVSARDLILHLETVMRGGASLSGEIARSVLDVVRTYGATSEESQDAPKRLTLTSREQDVLRCLSRGLSYKQVAEDLSVSLDTVRDHIRRIYGKLQVHSAAEAVSRAVREKLI